MGTRFQSRAGVVGRRRPGRWSRLTVHRVDALLDQRVRDVAGRSVGDRPVGKSTCVLGVLFASSSTSSLGTSRVHATETRSSARFVNVVWLLEYGSQLRQN